MFIYVYIIQRDIADCRVYAYVIACVTSFPIAYRPPMRLLHLKIANALGQAGQGAAFFEPERRQRLELSKAQPSAAEPYAHQYALSNKE